MQSPTINAGLRSIATSLWLHFVASPQRVPFSITGYEIHLKRISSIDYPLLATTKHQSREQPTPGRNEFQASQLSDTAYGPDFAVETVLVFYIISS